MSIFCFNLENFSLQIMKIKSIPYLEILKYFPVIKQKSCLYFQYRNVQLLKSMFIIMHSIVGCIYTI